MAYLVSGFRFEVLKFLFSTMRNLELGTRNGKFERRASASFFNGLWLNSPFQPREAKLRWI